MNILIPMAGAGSRFKSVGYELPKPLIDVCGSPMIEKCINSLNLEGQYIFVVRKYEEQSNSDKLRQLLENIVDNPIVIEIEKMTDGAAQTCLLAKEHINNDDPLISVNCDQILEWNSEKFLNFVNNNPYDGVVVTYDSNSEKNSYIQLGENNLAIRLAEKEVISNLSLTGIHYWKKGSHFVKSAECMIKENTRTKNEYYVAPTYNVMIRDKLKVSNYHIDNDVFHPVGTPEDLETYIARTKQD